MLQPYCLRVQKQSKEKAIEMTQEDVWRPSLEVHAKL